MINELPKTEIVALYVFAHFILMEKPIDFIINNQIIEDDYLISTLSIDEDGQIHENSTNVFVVTFKLILSTALLQKKLEKSEKEKGSRLTFDDYSIDIVDFIYEQIAPQIYEQALSQHRKLSLIKAQCIESIKKISKLFEMDMFTLYHKVMMPLVHIKTSMFH